jgi:penicillin-binding protein 2
MNQNEVQKRSFVIRITFIGLILLCLFKVLFLQIWNDDLKNKAQNNVIAKQIHYPIRGSIFDRNDELMVGNIKSYDLMVVPKYVKNLDTNLLCDLAQISKERLKKKLWRAKRYSRILESTIIKNMSIEKSNRLFEQMYKFPGFSLKERYIRYYPKPIAAQTLGYISRVTPNVLQKDKYYDPNDDYGRTGVEKTYESFLRGDKGFSYMFRDVHNRFVKNANKENKAVEHGHNIQLTLDYELQDYAQKLMQNKMGSVVAIEPRTGEILALVSAPSYDPNLLSGRERNKNYLQLKSDTTLPLFERSLKGSYPPGSTFKLVNALVGLQEGVVTKNTYFPCHRGWRYSPKLKVGCHAHRSPMNLTESIAHSCNAYYCNLFQKILHQPDTTFKANYKKWEHYVKSFGLGNYLNNDLHVGQKGLVPSFEYNSRRYPFRWSAPTVITLSIGQDALLVTPIQMANMTAAIANRGWYYTPHILKSVDHEASNLDDRFFVKHKIPIDSVHFETVIGGMDAAVNSKWKGVTAKDGRIPGIRMCGKTGTAQNPHGEDHSIFIAFAPKEDPKIAVAVYVENAGWGSTFGVPIASLMIEKYLKGAVSRPEMEAKIIKLSPSDIDFGSH